MSKDESCDAHIYFLDGEDKERGPISFKCLSELYAMEAIYRYTKIRDGKTVKNWTEIQDLPQYTALLNLQKQLNPTTLQMPGTSKGKYIIPSATNISPTGSEKSSFRESMEFYTSQTGETWLILNGSPPNTDYGCLWFKIIMSPFVLVHLFSFIGIILAMLIIPGGHNNLQLLAVYHASFMTSGVVTIVLCVFLCSYNPIGIIIGGIAGFLLFCLGLYTVIGHRKWYIANVDKFPPSKAMKIDYEHGKLVVKVSKLKFGLFVCTIDTIDVKEIKIEKGRNFASIMKQEKYGDCK